MNPLALAMGRMSIEEIEQKVREMCVIKPKGENEELESENTENVNLDNENNENRVENTISGVNKIGTDRIL